VPLGTYTQLTQRYVFTGTFNVAAGAILNVSDGAAMVGDDLNYAGVAIVINGTMNVTDAQFTHTFSSGTAAITMNAGGHLTATNPSFAWSNVTLNAGTADFRFLSFANKLTINSVSAATSYIHFNDFSNTLTAGGVIAAGVATAHIDLTSNYWGTTDPTTIGTKIHDHLDNATLPYIDFSPPLPSPQTSFFNPASLSPATAGVNYNQAITAVSGTGPATNFTVSSGALPAGMSLSVAGVLSGTPSATGSYTITISASDPSVSGGIANQIYWLFVDAPIITFTPGTLPASKTGVNYSQPLSAIGGTAPYSQFVVSAGTLPDGLSLSTSGTISGTPTVDGTFNFAITAQDSTTGLAAPYTGTQNFTIVVDDTPPTAGTVNDGLGADVNFQSSMSSITANWSGFADLDSGIASYAWAIGTSPGGQQVQVFTNVGNVLNASASGLSLSDGTK
jgi:hypothetical protein